MYLQVFRQGTLFFIVSLINLSIFAYNIYTGLSLKEYTNIFIIETILIIGFFILEYAVFNFYEVVKVRKKILKAVLAILGNTLMCLLCYGFILWATYFVANKEIIITSDNLRSIFFGELFRYKYLALILFSVYLIDSIKTLSLIRFLENYNWFFLRPHIRMLVFWFCIVFVSMGEDIYFLLLIKIFLDGFYFLFTYKPAVNTKKSLTTDFPSNKKSLEETFTF